MPQASPVDFWLYCSVSTIERAHAAVAVRDIVDVSRPRNNALHITGALMFTGAQFVQYIEGPQPELDEVRASIMADARHRNVMTIAQGHTDKRKFSEWSLAYAGNGFYLNRLVEWCRERHPHTSRALLERILRRLACG